jgi:hypothetical protein
MLGDFSGISKSFWLYKSLNLLLTEVLRFSDTQKTGKGWFIPYQTENKWPK